jgi:hypothetical protein
MLIFGFDLLVDVGRWRLLFDTCFRGHFNLKREREEGKGEKRGVSHNSPPTPKQSKLKRAEINNNNNNLIYHTYTTTKRETSRD